MNRIEVVWKKCFRVQGVQERKPGQSWAYYQDFFDFHFGQTFDTREQAEEYIENMTADHFDYAYVVESERIVYLYEGREFDFSVSGPVHHDYACDAEVTEAYFVDGKATDEEIEALVDAIYEELADTIFEMATTP